VGEVKTGESGSRSGLFIFPRGAAHTELDREIIPILSWRNRAKLSAPLARAAKGRSVAGPGPVVWS
jgi:hypothetical protein